MFFALNTSHLTNMLRFQQNSNCNGAQRTPARAEILSQKITLISKFRKKYYWLYTVQCSSLTLREKKNRELELDF